MFIPVEKSTCTYNGFSNCTLSSLKASKLADVAVVRVKQSAQAPT